MLPDEFPYNVPTDLSAEAGESIERIIAAGPPQWVRDLIAQPEEE